MHQNLSGEVLGVRIASKRLSASGFQEGQVEVAVRRAHDQAKTGALVGDLVRIVMDKGWDIESTVYVTDVEVSSLELSRDLGDISRVRFDNCIFGRLEIEEGLNPARLPTFSACYIAEVEGCAQDCLPKQVFDENCMFEKFTRLLDTNDAILDSDLPLGTQVLMTVLRKLYLQRGSGRKESALRRGLHHSAERLVPDILRLLQTEGMTTNYPRGTETIWLPIRSEYQRAARIISSPNASSDILVTKSRNL